MNKHVFESMTQYSEKYRHNGTVNVNKFCEKGKKTVENKACVCPYLPIDIGYSVCRNIILCLANCGCSCTFKLQILQNEALNDTVRVRSCFNKYDFTSILCLTFTRQAQHR